jgi:hypothetical protein
LIDLTDGGLVLAICLPVIVDVLVFSLSQQHNVKRRASEPLDLLRLSDTWKEWGKPSDGRPSSEAHKVRQRPKLDWPRENLCVTIISVPV